MISWLRSWLSAGPPRGAGQTGYGSSLVFGRRVARNIQRMSSGLQLEAPVKIVDWPRPLVASQEMPRASRTARRSRAERSAGTERQTLRGGGSRPPAPRSPRLLRARPR